MNNIPVSNNWKNSIPHSVNPLNEDEIIFNQTNAIIPPFDMVAFRTNPYFITNLPALDLQITTISDMDLINQYLEAVILTGQNILNTQQELFTAYSDFLNKWTAQLLVAHLIALYQWNLVGGNTLTAYKQSEGMSMADVMHDSKYWTKTRFGLQVHFAQLNQPQVNGYNSDNIYMDIGG